LSALVVCETMVDEIHARPVICDLRLEFPSHESAETVHRAVEQDNEGFVESRVEGSSIIARMEADTLKSLLHTLDDYLSCMGVAENIVTKKR